MKIKNIFCAVVIIMVLLAFVDSLYIKENLSPNSSSEAQAANRSENKSFDDFGELDRIRSKGSIRNVSVALGDMNGNGKLDIVVSYIVDMQVATRIIENKIPQKK